MVHSWEQLFEQEQLKDYFIELQRFISDERRSGKVIYPPEAQVFDAFRLTPLEQVKVVILGQDPYHGSRQAHGLCFSVQDGVKCPPSLANIYKELAADIDGFVVPAHGHLVKWAQQGVLMLNTVLTVEQGKAHSHAKAGWETFTDRVISILNARQEKVIFVLWGSHAQKKAIRVDTDKHQVLAGPHPSPLSAYRGFFGCGHFSMINRILQQQGNTQIDWQV